MQMKKKQTVVLFGSKSDPEINKSLKQIKRAGRRVKVEPPPGDSHFEKAIAFEGDNGPTMGAAF